MSAVTVYQSRLKAVRDRTAGTLADMYDELPDLHDDTANAFARRAAPIVRAGQLVAARTTNSYLARRARVTPARLDPLEVTGEGARPTDLLDVYRRPFGAAWKALADGSDLTDARRIGRDRLTQLAVTDVWLATRAAAAVLDRSSPKITGWVRVADPGACDLCASADGMPTDAAADMAGHPGCGCTQEPTFADSDTSEPSDADAVDVHEHDELGPVLYAAGHSFAAL